MIPSKYNNNNNNSPKQIMRAEFRHISQITCSKNLNEPSNPKSYKTALLEMQILHKNISYPGPSEFFNIVPHIIQFHRISFSSQTSYSMTNIRTSMMTLPTCQNKLGKYVNKNEIKASMGWPGYF